MPFSSKKLSLYKKVFSVFLLLLTLLYSISVLLTDIHTRQIVQSVQGAGYAVKTGYYIGNGRRLSITGLGFQPDSIIIKSDTSNTAAIFKTSAMPVQNMAYFSATVDNRDLRLTLDSDGFTVSEADRFKLDNDGFTLRNSANINIQNVKYTYIAFTGSDCESPSSVFCIGMYTGSTSTTQSINTGFKPDLLLI